MQVLHGLDSVPPEAKGLVLAIGNFDGVHRGHQAILARTRGVAKSLGAPAGVMTFEPHAREYFRPDRPMFRLTPLPRKLELFGACGLDAAIVLPFEKALVELSARGFVTEWLVGKLAVRHVVVGFHFFFGKGREGTPDTLRALGEELGFGVTIIAPEGTREEVFSSTRVRELLAEGHVRDAADMLGHWWRVTGKVIGGNKIGTGMGFPTANIQLPKGVQLHHGIYGVRVRHKVGQIGGGQYKGAAYLGTRPTFDNGLPVLEVFLFDFDSDIYGEVIDIDFIAFLRADAKFRSVEALMAQMDKDCEAARVAVAAADREDPMAAYPLGRTG
jgi:riboflavin kinase / FMN adenylyltransferase